MSLRVAQNARWAKQFQYRAPNVGAKKVNPYIYEIFSLSDLENKNARECKRHQKKCVGFFQWSVTNIFMLSPNKGTNTFGTMGKPGLHTSRKGCLNLVPEHSLQKWYLWGLGSCHGDGAWQKAACHKPLEVQLNWISRHAWRRGGKPFLGNIMSK